MEDEVVFQAYTLEKIYAHDYRGNGNINKAFPWVFLFVPLFDPCGQ